MWMTALEIWLQKQKQQLNNQENVLFDLNVLFFMFLFKNKQITTKKDHYEGPLTGKAKLRTCVFCNIL